LEVIVNRNGEMGGILPLWFDGAVCDFKELPKPEDKAGMKTVYDNCKKMDAAKSAPKPSPTQTTTTKPVLLLSMANNIRHFININFKH
jgi:hypothetical protein